MKKSMWGMALGLMCLSMFAAGGGAETFLPVFDAANFSPGATIDNPYFPLKPGTLYTYRGESEEGGTILHETSKFFVTFQTQNVLGIPCTVVSDKSWINGDLEEQTTDWFAQDKSGNVWYMGEDTKVFSNGQVVSTAGSWMGGKDGALPGYVMKANPVPGENPYYQEYYVGKSQDTAQVMDLLGMVSVPYGDYSNCLKTLEWSPLDDPLIYENKFYASGVGLLLTRNLDTDSTVELVSIQTIPEPMTLTLMAIGGMMVLGRRNKNK